MRRSSLLLITGFALGFGLGFFVWQKQIGSRLREENARLRNEVKDVEALRAENAMLAGGRVDPDELKRLQDGQTELLRLRGQVSKLRDQINEAQAAAKRTPVTPTASPATAEPSPVETFTAKTVAKVGWQQTLVTGGWKLPSGNRGLIMLQPVADPNAPNSVQVRARVLEIPESLLPAIEELKPKGNDANGHSVLTPEEAQALLTSLRQSGGATVLASPTVTTVSGQQAQVAVVQTFTGPNGESYSIGPVVEITPTISPDNQSIDVSVDARLNLRKPGP